jgi:hypothetical protein
MASLLPPEFVWLRCRAAVFAAGISVAGCCTLAAADGKIARGVAASGKNYGGGRPAA